MARDGIGGTLRGFVEGPVRTKLNATERYSPESDPPAGQTLAVDGAVAEECRNRGKRSQAQSRLAHFPQIGAIFENRDIEK